MHIKKIRRFQKRILTWERGNFKEYPWRFTSDPFFILISEILLQKTDARKVVKVYPKFIDSFPTVYSLYHADIQDIKSFFMKIGLFYRAQRLKEISTQIIKVFNGKIPDEKEKLLSIGGIGNYISNAILCFAFKKRVPIVDSNVIRVYQRVFNVRSSKPRPRTDNMLWRFAEEILPSSDYVRFNYALLDFASEVCKARNPLCEICEVKKICSASVYDLNSLRLELV